MAPRKSTRTKAKDSKASGKASPLAKKAKPTHDFKKLDPSRKASNSKAIILASSVPIQPQTSQKTSASASRKGAPSPKAGSSSAASHGARFRSPAHVQYYYSDVRHRSIVPDRNIMLEEGEYNEIQTEIARRCWEFICQIAGQGRQVLTHEFYTNGWKVKGEDWPQFTTYVLGKEVHFDVDHINKILFS
ncbi:hypothetical protein SESBI_01567 [Sesbania bispinosa]|nr:hypothetical protein SESBI_01567 [Sesbania bispinosa]